MPNRAALVTIISVRPMMALSGVRSSWLMLARNCDLCWLAICKLAALVLDLREQARILDRQHRLGGECLQQINHIRREILRGCLRRTTSAPTIFSTSINGTMSALESRRASQSPAPGLAARREYQRSAAVFCLESPDGSHPRRRCDWSLTAAINSSLKP